MPSTAVERAAQVTLTRTHLPSTGHVPTTVAPMAKNPKPSTTGWRIATSRDDDDFHGGGHMPEATTGAVRDEGVDVEPTV